MTLIEIETYINAPIERVFDLARSIDAHIESAEGTHERAIAGRTMGLIEEGETVTWEASHLGMKQNLTAQITRLTRPSFFEDKMTKGALAEMKHRHHFRVEKEGTVMKDEFYYRAPYGVLGRVVESSFLTAYLRRFLRQRALALKAMAESEKWRDYLPD